jgi:hypothetical protein
MIGELSDETLMMIDVDHGAGVMLAQKRSLRF